MEDVTMLNTAIPQDTLRESMPAAFRVAIRTLAAWGFTHHEMAATLGLESRTLYRYKRQGLPARAISPDLIERTSYVLGIEKALEILLAGEPEQEEHDIRRWINSPSDAPLFAGHPPKGRLTTGRAADLFQVRQYLDGWRGGDFA